MLSVQVPRTIPDGHPAAWSVSAPVLAALAADAAAGVHGVVRLEVGIADLVSSTVKQARQRLAGVAPATTEGVRVRVEPATGVDLGGADVELDIAVDGLDQVAAVARAVQRAVRDRVREATGVVLRSVAVNVLSVVGARR